MSCSRTISAITCFRKHKKSLNWQSLNKIPSTKPKAHIYRLCLQSKEIQKKCESTHELLHKNKKFNEVQFSKLRLECTKIQTFPNWKPKEIRKLYQYRKMLFAVTCCLHNFQSEAINKIFKNFSNYTNFFFFLRHILLKC